MNKEESTRELIEVKKDPIELVSPDSEITLKEFTVADAKEIFEVIDRNREFLSRNHEDTAEKYKDLQSVEESIDHPKNPERRRFAIRNKDKVLIGSINITTDNQNHEEAEIGYWQGEEFTGKGYMGRAVETLTKFGFENLGYKTIYGRVFLSNEASIRVLQKAGFKETNKIDGYVRLEKSKNLLLP